MTTSGLLGLLKYVWFKATTNSPVHCRMAVAVSLSPPAKEAISASGKSNKGRGRRSRCLPSAFDEGRAPSLLNVERVFPKRDGSFSNRNCKSPGSLLTPRSIANNNCKQHAILLEHTAAGGTGAGFLWIIRPGLHGPLPFAHQAAGRAPQGFISRTWRRNTSRLWPSMSSRTPVHRSPEAGRAQKQKGFTTGTRRR